MADTKSKTNESGEGGKDQAPPPPPPPAPPSGRLSAAEIAERLAALEAPKPDTPPVWAPPKVEDLVYAEVGPRFAAVDDVTRRKVGPGERGHFHKEVLARHPDGFLPVGADGKVRGAFPVLRSSSRLETGPALQAPEPLVPKPEEGAPAA